MDVTLECSKICVFSVKVPAEFEKAVHSNVLYRAQVCCMQIRRMLRLGFKYLSILIIFEALFWTEYLRKGLEH